MTLFKQMFCYAGRVFEFCILKIIVLFRGKYGGKMGATAQVGMQ